jgi:hypothetical protein
MMSFEKMKSSSIVFAKEERLSVHIQILSAVSSHCDEFVGEKDRS